MEKMSIYLNGIKSGCFVLLTCLSLVFATTSCNNDEFEFNEPEDVLVRLPRTRANEPYPVVMSTTGRTIQVKCVASEEVIVYWDNENENAIPPNNHDTYMHTFSTTGKEHTIYIEASKSAIKELDLSYNGLSRLNIKNNINLQTLSCDFNLLTELDFSGCEKLTDISATYNELSSIDVTNLPYLEKLNLSWNQLTGIDVSQNANLHTLDVGMNLLEEIDVSNNQHLKTLNVEYNYSMKSLDLTKNTTLNKLFLAGLPIETINNRTINHKSFASFPDLEELDISYTPFKTLTLSSNPMIYGIGIAGTDISTLDVSNLQIAYLHASAANLTNFIYTEASCVYLVDLQIGGTPFEKVDSNLWDLATDALPDRHQPDMNGQITKGFLSTMSSYIVDSLSSYLTRKNWGIYLQN